MMGENVATLTLLEVPWLYWLCLGSQRQLRIEGLDVLQKWEGKREGGVRRVESFSPSLPSRCYVSHAVRIP